MPRYEDILRENMKGNPDVAATFSAPTSAGYTGTLASTYAPTAGAYQSTVGTYAPTAGAYRPTAGAFLPGVKAALAPYAVQTRNALAAARRTLPAGGGREAALGTIL